MVGGVVRGGLQGGVLVGGGGSCGGPLGLHCRECGCVDMTGDDNDDVELALCTNEGEVCPLLVSALKE